MLKIKDNVDLKELEKFGFKEYFYCFTTPLLKYDYECTLIISVIKENRLISLDIQTDDYNGSIKELDILYDLIQAGLVEKVQDEWFRKD